MHSPATTAAAIPTNTPVTTAATSSDQHEHDNASERSATKQVPVLTRDSHLDTFFSPVWMSGPNVFSFAKDGTIVRPETYALEPYPGYHAERTRRLRSVGASHFHGFWTGDSKPWKSVAITEQDDTEFEALRERAWVNALEEWRRNLQYGPAAAPPSISDEPELVYTWPPEPTGGKGDR